MIVCVMLSQDSGGRLLHTEHWRTTQFLTQRSLILKHSCVSGYLLWKVSRVKEEYSTVKHLKSKLQSMVGVIQNMSLELTLAVRLYLDHISSVILLKSWLELQIHMIVLHVRSSWQRFLALFSLPSLSSHICEKCGNEIPKKNDCWVCRSLE